MGVGMVGGCRRHWLGMARGFAALALLACAPAFATQAPAKVATAPSALAPLDTPAALADELPRHALETKALVAPGAVLREVPPRLAEAAAKGDFKEQALLQLARANACRVLANWPCQRTASTAARMDAALAQDRVLQVRALVAEARAYLSMQEYNRGESLLGAAEHIL